MLVGVIIALTPINLGGGLTHDFIFYVILPPLLFDMQADPYEMHNLAERPEHGAVMLRYAQKMLSWRMRYAERTLANLHLSSKGVFDGRRRSLVS